MTSQIGPEMSHALSPNESVEKPCQPHTRHAASGYCGVHEQIETRSCCYCRIYCFLALVQHLKTKVMYDKPPPRAQGQKERTYKANCDTGKSLLHADLY